MEPKKIDQIEEDILFKAIKKNDIEGFKKSFNEEKLLEIDGEGRNLLHAAIAKGSLEITKYILAMQEKKNLDCQELYIGIPKQGNSFKFNSDKEESFIHKNNSSPAIMTNDLHGKLLIELDNDVPIFIIAQKENLQPVDFEIAKILLEKNSNKLLTIKNIEKKTPIELLEERLKDKRKTSTIKNPRSSANYATARNIFKSLVKKHMNDDSIKDQILKYWYLFADSQITSELMVTELIEQKYRINEKDKNFFDALLTWEYDTVLVTPNEAWEIYRSTKPLISKKKCFMFLLHYLILRSKSFEREQSNLKPNLSQKQLIKRKPRDVAKALYSIHRDMFLNINPTSFVISSCRNDKGEELEKFLARYEYLSQEVARSILLDLSPKTDSLPFWGAVAKHLLKFNDLFGYWAVSMGITDNEIYDKNGNKIKVKKFKQFTSYKDYVAIKNKKLAKLKNKNNNSKLSKISGLNKKSIKTGLIPATVKESAHLLSSFENIKKDVNNLFNPSSGQLKNVIDPFIEEINKIREHLNESKLDDEKRETSSYPLDLYLYFKDIPYGKSTKTTKLLSLRSKTEKKKRTNVQDTFKLAEHWNTYDLYLWIESLDRQGFIDEIVKMNIDDGAAFLEKFAFFSCNSKSINDSEKLSQIFLDYEGWALRQKKDPLGKLDKDNQYPIDIFKYPENSFHWIMWLRNQGITVMPFMKHGVINAKIFISIRSRVSGKNNYYKKLEIEDDKVIKKLEHLKDLWKLHQESKKIKMISWEMINFETAIYSLGLSNLIPLIKKDKIWDIDKILALFYVYQKFGSRKFTKLKYGNAISLVFNELAKNHDLVMPLEGKNNKDLQVKNNENNSANNNCNSWLFLIKVLIKIGAVDRWMQFYKNNLFSMQDIQSKFSPERVYTKSMIYFKEQPNIFNEQTKTSLSFLGLTVAQSNALIKHLTDM
jgi:hypothetical protein